MIRKGYTVSVCKLETWSNLALCVWLLSSWRTSTFKVPDSFSQAATTGPGDINLPRLHLATSNGAPMLISSDSIARLRALSPTTLLCLPHPVKMLQQKKPRGLSLFFFLFSNHVKKVKWPGRSHMHTSIASAILGLRTLQSVCWATKHEALPEQPQKTSNADLSMN